VLVTGGAGGIGRVLVETLAVMKVTVVVIDRVPFEDDRGQS
jgi:nucleoside-diphosphate-sugar epimerase